MTSSSFETKLYHRLSDFFGQHDYVLLPDKKQFRKTTSAGFQNIIPSATVYADETWLEINFGCRHQQIEQIAQQFLNNLPGYRADANTTIISIGKYNNVKYFRYHVQSADDLDDTCLQIEQFFTNTGFQFLEATSSLPVLDRLLNQLPTQPSRFVYNQTHRCFKGLIAARLNNNMTFGYLLDIYRNSLEQSGSSELEQVNFERLAEFLVYYSRN